MLKQTISKARRILKDAQQNLPVESAAAVEQVYNDIVVLNNFINKELSAVEINSSLDESSKKAARRGVFEKAGRKLETIKAKKKYLDAGDYHEVKPADRTAEDEQSLLEFFREKEVRDRLGFMTETQIISLFGDSLYDGSNPLLVRAILNAPAGLEPVSKETLNKMTKEILSRRRKTGALADDDLTQTGNLNAMVGEIFSLAKKELDKLRRKELPTALIQTGDSRDRPFKF
jgi:hypothetical protein